MSTSHCPSIYQYREFPVARGNLATGSHAGILRRYKDLSKWQRVQNCLAHVVLTAPRFSPSLPLLKQLHWLPVNYRIKFKLSTVTYRAHAIHQPPYLASLLHFSNIPRQLRSSTDCINNKPRSESQSRIF